MKLFFNGRKLKNTETISQCGITNSSLIVQKKIGLDEVPGIQTTTKPDCITFDDDSSQVRALMPCGHAVSSETMTSILQSLIDSKKYEIKCPAQKGEVTIQNQSRRELCDTI